MKNLLAFIFVSFLFLNSSFADTPVKYYMTQMKKSLRTVKKSVKRERWEKALDNIEKFQINYEKAKKHIPSYIEEKDVENYKQGFNEVLLETSVLKDCALNEDVECSYNSLDKIIQIMKQYHELYKPEDK
jgi:soluble cytochrome b562